MNVTIIQSKEYKDLLVAIRRDMVRDIVYRIIDLYKVCPKEDETCLLLVKEALQSTYTDISTLLDESQTCNDTILHIAAKIPLSNFSFCMRIEGFKTGITEPKRDMDILNVFRVILRATERPLEFAKRKNNFQCTPMHYSILSYNVDMVIALLEIAQTTQNAREMVSLKDCLGRTPLGLARERHVKKMEEILQAVLDEELDVVLNKYRTS